jgi:hypothetical protein
MWMLFAHSMLPRGLTTSTFEARVDAMFGCHDWAKVYEDRRANLIPAAVLRDQLTNLMRWRLERVLGYKRTHAFEMKNHGGSPIYTMIFATDNAAGDRIMTHIYGQAAEKQPQMRAEAVAQMQAIKEEEAGTPGLFPPLPRATPTAKLYRHTSPTRPYGKNLCTDCAVQPTG